MEQIALHVEQGEQNSTEKQIILRQVCLRYAGGVRALDDVSFSVKAGEMVFLTGHSGAGKSSVLRLLSLQEKLTRGQLYLEQQDLCRLPNRRIPLLRRKLGMIFQDHRLLLNKNVFENVALPLRIAGLSYFDLSKRVRVALKRVGLNERELALPGMLSTGEQQRVGIARAIVHQPSIVLADEPTGNLDPRLALEIMQLFIELNEQNMTLLIASHDLRLIKHLGRRVLVLQDGRLIDDIPARSGQGEVGR